ncbi:MAG: murein biosynthesis integral membrane protein MurJ [Candidatus Nanopelagicales bacterium]
MNQLSKLLRNTSAIALGTVLSRITGLIRTAVIVAALGFGPLADAYAIGNTLPNIIYILTVGGALNAVFIPQLVRRMKDDSDGGKAFTDRLVTATLLILFAITLAVVLLAPWLVKVYLPTDWAQSDKEATLLFARFLLPQIFFYGLFTLMSQILNSRDKFILGAYAPIVNNIVVIITGMAFITQVRVTNANIISDASMVVLAVGTTLGIVLQALMMVPVVYRSGYKYRPRFDFKNSGLGKTSRLATWTVGLVLVNQIGYAAVTRIAATANDATVNTVGVTAYQNAHLVMLLPHAVITVSLVTALLPSLARTAHQKDLVSVGVDIERALRMLAIVIVPLSLMVLAHGRDIMVALFARGNANYLQTSLSGVVLSAFALSLIPFTMFYVLSRAAYAQEDTKTPFYLTILMNITQLVVAAVFLLTTARPYWVTGLAIGYTAGYTAAAIGMYLVLRKPLQLHLNVIGKTVINLIIISVPAIALSRVIVGLVEAFLPNNAWAALLQLVVAGVVAITAFFGLAQFRPVKEIDEVWQLIRRKPNAKTS